MHANYRSEAISVARVDVLVGVIEERSGNVASLLSCSLDNNSWKNSKSRHIGGYWNCLCIDGGRWLSSHREYFAPNQWLFFVFGDVSASHDRTHIVPIYCTLQIVNNRSW